MKIYEPEVECAGLVISFLICESGCRLDVISNTASVMSGERCSCKASKSTRT